MRGTSRSASPRGGHRRCRGRIQRVCRDAIVGHGIPAVADFNDLDHDTGVAPFPVNIDGSTRVNSAFAYVDPVRDRLTVLGDAPVERVLVRDDRAVGVVVRDGERLIEIGASRVVLSAGAYGSPAILLRSGIGPASELIAVGLKPALDLPGVGRNLRGGHSWNGAMIWRWFIGVACLRPLSREACA